MRLMLIVGTVVVLAASVKAEKPKPAALPVKAAQDLDYALYSQQRKVKKVLTKYQKLADEEIKQITKDELELINQLQNQYSFRLFDEKGQPLDTVDPDTGTITRALTKLVEDAKKQPKIGAIP